MRVVDCFFQPHGRAADFSSVEAAHTQIIDQVVELDEQLMALYLEQGEELSPEQLHDPFEQALREGHLIPVCFVLGRGRRGRAGAAAGPRAAHAQPDRGQSAALPEGKGEAPSECQSRPIRPGT